MPPLIEVGDISRVFTGGAKTVFALEHVSCDIHSGQFRLHRRAERLRQKHAR